MAASQFDATEELRGFVDLNFARRLEMAEILTPTHVRALERFWPEATSEVIAGGYCDLWRANLSRESHRRHGSQRPGDVGRCRACRGVLSFARRAL